MTLFDAMILLGLILIMFGCVFYVIAMLMERYYDRKLWELDQRLRKDDKWRDKQQIETAPTWRRPLLNTALMRSETERKKMDNKYYYVAVSDITFYLYDEDGNAKTDKSGNEISYRLKDGMRFKPLEYIADGLEPDMLQPIK